MVHPRATPTASHTTAHSAPTASPTPAHSAPTASPTPAHSAETGGGTKFGTKKIIQGVLVVALLGVVAFFAWQSFQKEAALAVGNCLVFTGTAEDADHELVDCSDESVYSEYVGEVIEGDGECSDPLSGSYSIVEDDTKVTKVTCLIPQLAEGQCYLSTPEGSVNEFESVDCGSDHELEVVTVLDESEAQCDDGLNPVSFTTPARTYCLAYTE